jgi:hypothetical protein
MMYLRNEFTTFLTTILASSDYKTELEGSTPYKEAFRDRMDRIGWENLGWGRCDKGNARCRARDAVHAMQ